MVPLACYFNTLFLTVGSDILKSLPLIITLIVLLILSSFFSMLETALSSVNIIRLKSYVDEKKAGSKKALYLAEKFDITLVTLLVGNNLVNIAATTIAAIIISKFISDPTLSSIANTFIMAFIILIFGEITPKSYASENAEKVCLRFSSILFVILKILWPFTFIFYQIRKLMMKRSSKDDQPQVTEEELENIIETMEDEGVIENEDALLMQNVIDINDTTAYEIMTPRVDVVAVSIKESSEAIKNVFFEYQYSRMPVYDRDKDNIIGVIRERDFFTEYVNNPNNYVDIRKIMTKPYYVSESTKVDDLIREMQALKNHFAIVVDEYGGTSGIVTLEDALEELVGEIYDESDERPDDQQMLRQVSDNKYIINPEYDLEDLFEELNLGDAPESKYRNVGGFVYELCEELPYKGKVVKYNTTYETNDLENTVLKEYELFFKIERVSKRRIMSILLTIKDITDENNDK